MATLQLPANNLANLANLPPGTKLYLTTNSKNPSGKGKLLLIPQGAILRASSAGWSFYYNFDQVSCEDKTDMANVIGWYRIVTINLFSVRTPVMASSLPDINPIKRVSKQVE